MGKIFFKKGLSPINRRRLNAFKANKRGFYSFWVFVVLMLITLPAEFLANDKPIVINYKDEILFPIFVNYPESKFGGFFATTDYRDPFIKEEIESNGWMVWPPLKYSYRTINKNPEHPAPAPPSKENLLGTDDQSRDVLARLIYGFRISVLFSFCYTFIAALIGISLGGIQGYFGGWLDLIFQRLIEIWAAIPMMMLALILASIFKPNFFILLGILSLNSWGMMTAFVRAEFLRTRNFDYIRAARAIGISNFRIMFRHILPNAMVAAITILPVLLAAGVTLLTMLDFLGFGLPAGSASLGEMVKQGRTNIQAPHLGLTAVFTLAVLISLLWFIGEAIRDALNPKKAVGMV